METNRIRKSLGVMGKMLLDDFPTTSPAPKQEMEKRDQKATSLSSGGGGVQFKYHVGAVLSIS